jgi:hypothetical protein
LPTRGAPSASAIFTTFAIETLCASLSRPALRPNEIEL